MEDENTLKRSLTLTETTMLSIGNIIGAGVFVLLGTIVMRGKDNVLPIFLIAMTFNLIAASCYAELGAMYQSNSMEYQAINDAYGPWIAKVSTVILLLFLIVTIATLATMFGTYLSDHAQTQFCIALALVFSLSIINFIGIDASKAVTTGLGSLKLAMLIILISIGVFYIKFSKAIPQTPPQLNVYVLCSFLAIFLFNGYDAVVKMSDEIKDPQRTIPLSLMISLTTCSVIYILIALLALSMNIQGPRVINDLFNNLIQHPLTNPIIYAIGAATIFNTTFISILALSRFVYGISKDHKIPMLTQINHRFQTPHNAILAVFITVCFFLILGNFEYSVILTNTFLIMFMLFLMTSVIILRKKQAERNRPFKIPFNIANVPVPVIIGILMVIFYAVYIPQHL